MNAAAGLPGREFEQLRQLLLRTETERLDSLEAKVNGLDDRVGTPAQLETSTAAVLANAFRQAEANSPRELASAVAPSILSTIQAEIRNSRDVIVESIYPIAGRLVTAAVANAFKDLVATLQQQIDALISVNQWRWRIQSLTTGRPVSEIALASMDRLKVIRLFLIERGSGRLLASWSSEAVTDQNPDIVSGMLAAIIEFSTQAFAGSGTLRTIDFGGREIAIRASARAIVAAECAGPIKSWDNSRIDKAFLSLIDSMNDNKPVTESDLASLATSMKPNAQPGGKSRASRFILIGLASVAAISILWFAGVATLHKFHEHKVQSSLTAEIDRQSILESYPLRLDFTHDQKVVRLEGLLPLAADQEALTRVIADAAAPYRLKKYLTVVADPQQLTMLQARIENLQTAILAAQSQSLEKLVEIDKKVADSHATSSDKFAGAAKNIAELQATLDSPFQRLARYSAETAIFFGNAAEYLDAEAARQSLDGLAGLLRDNNLPIRVVGHSDESGSADANRQIAKRRAEIVAAALVERGIGAGRINAVSRSASSPISDSIGGTRPGNRRVTFENLFSAETSR
jgi:outer membrane protein OmpA-like peptidoglycan-associated protein